MSVSSYLSPPTAFLFASFLAFLFVSSFYLFDPTTDRTLLFHPHYRNQAKVIRRRTLISCIICLIGLFILSILYLFVLPDLQVDSSIAFNTPDFLTFVGLPFFSLSNYSIFSFIFSTLIVSAPSLILFSGSIINEFLHGILSYRSLDKPSSSLLSHLLRPFFSLLRDSMKPGTVDFRNNLWAPISEEIFFRTLIVTILVLGGFKQSALLSLCPLLFAIAHAHFFIVKLSTSTWQQALFATLFQVFYTSIFGMIATQLYLNSSNLLAAILTHMISNIMGFPSFDFLKRHNSLYPYRFLIAASHILAISLFVYSFNYLTTFGYDDKNQCWLTQLTSSN
jgi:membrane protease YdiL (CAAX protease family)